MRPFGLLIYNRIEYTRKARDPSNKPKRNKPEPYTGQVTPFARKRIKRAIQLLVAISNPKEATHFKSGRKFKFRVNFLTLTLPCLQGNVSDRELKKSGLDVWLKRMRRKHKLRSYVWRAERQKNGNLHFHIITDTYLHWEKVRNDWNSCLSKFHFIDQFESEHKHRNPNSTDIHSVSRVTHLSQYLIKYMSKDELVREHLTNPPFIKQKYWKTKPPKANARFYAIKTKEECKIEGKIWDCSLNLKSKDGVEFIVDTGMSDDLNYIINKDPEQLKNTANCSLYFVKEDEFESRLTKQMNTEWNKYLDRVRSKAVNNDDGINQNTVKSN